MTAREMSRRQVMVYVAFPGGRPVLTTTPQPGAAHLGSIEGDIALEIAACLVCHGLAETPAVEALVRDCCGKAVQHTQSRARPDERLDPYLYTEALSS